MVTDHLSMRETRARLPEILNRAESGEATVITRNGKPVAAVIPLDEYSALEEAADERLAREALRHLGEPTSSMAEVLTEVFGEQDGKNNCT
ncbi:type II toxin-antitoxin system Phd/YefM family antitoxin [Streptomyces qinzhouensis]|uniref:Antitoxin n=1 Tax=Streptomyces qinzhouensis TaxID=2599401 RepID=A0A5B8J4S7_9ACTN|nr:type II toxin-antitoxin system Phd/YefM family antitoxin [Streptomyces qinzhouensis]QDY76267.1 type II toxin-antitoxin system Phd/YefM family antitoxin [Streptomyces qinzhouensis]